jgi:hypothetical protein
MGHPTNAAVRTWRFPGEPTTMRDSTPELMSVADFCTRYAIGRTSLYREVNAGRLKLRKFGSATRIARADAEAWAERLPVREGGLA